MNGFRSYNKKISENEHLSRCFYLLNLVQDIDLIVMSFVIIEYKEIKKESKCEKTKLTRNAVTRNRQQIRMLEL